MGLNRNMLGLILFGIVGGCQSVLGQAAPVITTPITPVSITETTSGSERIYTIDFKRTWFGTFTLIMKNSLGKRVEGVEVTTSECLRDGKVIMDAVGARTQRFVHYIEANQVKKMEGTKIFPLRAIQVKAPLVVGLDNSSIVLTAHHVPFDDNASSFVSDNPVLNDVFELCKHTVKATSVKGLYIDGVREYTPYEGDTYINLMSHYGLAADPEIAHRTMEYLMKNPTWPPEYKLQMILLAWFVYMETGNSSFMQSHYDTLKGRVRYCGDRNWECGGALVDYPSNFNTAKSSYTVALAYSYITTKVFSQIAEALGKNADAQDFQKKSEKTFEYINTRLYFEEKGVYQDIWYNEPNPKDPNPRTRDLSLHTNFYLAAFGLVPPSRKKRVLDFIRPFGMKCNVYGAQFLLDGLYELGGDDYALSLMSARDGNSWGHMMYTIGATTTLEYWDPSLKPNPNFTDLDWNHAWGTAPGNIIPRKLMGIRPVEPGYKKFLVMPKTGSLKKAAYRLPTVAGSIEVSIVSDPGKAIQMTISVPAGTTCDAYVPTLSRSGTDVLVNGKSRTGEIVDGFVKIASLPPGSHTLERSTQGTVTLRHNYSVDRGQLNFWPSELFDTRGRKRNAGGISTRTEQ